MYEEPLKRIASELGPDKSLLLLGSIVFAILFIIFGFGGAVDDVCVFYDYSQKLGAGLPYRDYSLGYPPLSLVIFAIPGLFTNDLYTYSVIFYAITTLFFIATLWIMIKICRLCGYDPKFICIIFIVICAVYYPQAIRKFDLQTAFFMILAIWLFLENKVYSAYLFLVIGAMIKIFPIFVLPVFLIFSLKDREKLKKMLISTVALIAAVALLIILATRFIPFSDLLNFVQYSTNRNFQQESLIGTISLLISDLGGAQSTLILHDYTYDVQSPLCDALRPVWNYVLLAAMGLIYLILAHLEFRRPNQDYTYNERLLVSSFVVMCVFILTYFVFSTQFILWFYTLIPFLVILDVKNRKRLALLIILVAAISASIPTFGFYSSVALARDLLLAMLILFSVSRLADIPLKITLNVKKPRAD